MKTLANFGNVNIHLTMNYWFKKFQWKSHAHIAFSNETFGFETLTIVPMSMIRNDQCALLGTPQSTHGSGHWQETIQLLMKCTLEVRKLVFYWSRNNSKFVFLHKKQNKKHAKFGEAWFVMFSIQNHRKY